MNTESMRFELDRAARDVTTVSAAAGRAEEMVSTVHREMEQAGKTNHDALLVLRHQAHEFQKQALAYIAVLEGQVLTLTRERSEAVARVAQLEGMQR